MTFPDGWSQLSQVFVALLPEHLKLHVTNDPRVILRIPARAPEVGELLVYDDGDELTVAVGGIYHQHFEVYCESGVTQREREQQAAENALRRVENIIADRVRFRHEFKNGRLVAASSWIPEHQNGGVLLESADEYREYTWTGEKTHGCISENN